eukprot:2160166-Pyramimonas_sp.AAC.1
MRVDRVPEGAAQNERRAGSALPRPAPCCLLLFPPVPLRGRPPVGARAGPSLTWPRGRLV